MGFKEKINKIKTETPGLNLFVNGTFTKPGTILSIILVLGFCCVMEFSTIKTELLDTAFKASAPCVTPVTIEYQDMDAVDLVDYDDFEIGQRYKGITNLFMKGGTYYNEELSLYDLYYCKANKTNLIKITYGGDLAYVVVNCKTPEATETLYNELSVKIK